ncbi:hypothetical protein OG21DRAFT_950469 [Imleria badia]|nr:hypothetical protein OG21DRAFT_950469 [Imleria badia]
MLLTNSQHKRTPDLPARTNRRRHQRSECHRAMAKVRKLWPLIVTRPITSCSRRLFTLVGSPMPLFSLKGTASSTNNCEADNLPLALWCGTRHLLGV